MSSVDIVIGVLLLTGFVLGCAVTIYLERREWNGGICRKSGLPWSRFDTDSQGGRGYTDGAGHYCWISYPVDRQ